MSLQGGYPKQARQNNEKADDLVPNKTAVDQLAAGDCTRRLNPPSKQIVVENFPPSVDIRDLDMFFGNLGTITNAYIISKQDKRCAFITFRTVEVALAAINDFHARPPFNLIVNFAIHHENNTSTVDENSFRAISWHSESPQEYRYINIDDIPLPNHNKESTKSTNMCLLINKMKAIKSKQSWEDTKMSAEAKVTKDNDDTEKVTKNPLRVLLNTSFDSAFDLNNEILRTPRRRSNSFVMSTEAKVTKDNEKTEKVTKKPLRVLLNTSFDSVFDINNEILRTPRRRSNSFVMQKEEMSKNWQKTAKLPVVYTSVIV